MDGIRSKWTYSEDFGGCKVMVMDHNGIDWNLVAYEVSREKHTCGIMLRFHADKWCDYTEGFVKFCGLKDNGCG